MCILKVANGLPTHHYAHTFMHMNLARLNMRSGHWGEGEIGEFNFYQTPAIPLSYLFFFKYTL